MSLEPMVFVVDDDPGVRKSLCWLIQSDGLAAAEHASASEFLRAYDARQPGCLLLDVRMPGMSGIELQQQLVERNVVLPVIIITGHGDVATCRQAMRAGAFEFMEKPVNDQALLDAIHQALARDRQIRKSLECNSRLKSCLESLTPREREVLDRLVAGRSTKEISAEFQISGQTAAKHRARVLQKLGVGSEVELMRRIWTSQAPATACRSCEFFACNCTPLNADSSFGGSATPAP